jgi:endonuclease YncB( thermonuclease family)
MKHWKPAKKTVELEPATRPSRIRREPVRTAADGNGRSYWRSVEWDRRFAVIGVVLVALAITGVVVGISVVTFSKDDPEAAARATEFRQCYEGGANCVVDGQTIYAAGQRIKIAGMVAPGIDQASCEGERDRGIEAAVGLASLLNRGRVVVGPPVRDAEGTWRRKVEVGGRDVAAAMIAANLARPEYGPRSWC